MEPIRNYPLYIWRVIGKWLSFFVFGLATLLLALVFFPIMSLRFRSRDQLRERGRRFVHGFFRFFVGFMHAVGVIRVSTSGDFAGLRGKVIIANHPSLLDVVILISLLPNADCIVNSALMDNPIVRGVVRRLYISNSLDFTELARDCTASLDEGNCLIIFPEGTRTRRSGPIHVKRGAARISLISGRPVVPVRIGGNDKWGLGKKDPWWAYNHNEAYHYDMQILREIDPASYAGQPQPSAVRHLTEAVKKELFTEEERLRIT